MKIIFLYLNCWGTRDYVGNGYEMRIYGYLRQNLEVFGKPQIKSNFWKFSNYKKFDLYEFSRKSLEFCLSYP